MREAFLPLAHWPSQLEGLSINYGSDENSFLYVIDQKAEMLTLQVRPGKIFTFASVHSLLLQKYGASSTLGAKISHQILQNFHF